MQRAFLKGRRPRARQSGFAVVELAICLPLMVMLTFGAIEASNAIYLKQTLVTAAYEAARMATALGATQQDGEARYSEIVSAVGVQGTTITFTPQITAITPAGTAIRVTVTAPADSNSFSIRRFMKGTTLRASVTMPRL
ncbi:TadE-like protein [Caulifigura coniformis]|uniref:TadE-like protein n=1 Tax=Caulifigura coniformis TaxID=2527983 RepID=A0A517S7G0_9PLAN|nr:TadE/TadG family type IV pilus assembly protein [Caulifigura coniformis]QDT52045.1 TadE-like protein [Caulifigura coniformis]